MRLLLELVVVLVRALICIVVSLWLCESADRVADHGEADCQMDVDQRERREDRDDTNASAERFEAGCTLQPGDDLNEEENRRQDACRCHGVEEHRKRFGGCLLANNRYPASEREDDEEDRRTNQAFDRPLQEIPADQRTND